MATNKELIEFIVDQAQDAGIITYKRMFGEYGLYCDGVFIALVCDDTLFCKVTKEGEQLLKDMEKEIVMAPAYPGARPSLLIEDIEDKELLAELFLTTKKALI